MPRRIPDFADSYQGWNFISSIGSIISVVATALFLYIVYDQLVYGKPVGRFVWGLSSFYSDTLQTQLNRAYPSLEWAINSPPKPHSYVSLPIQSSL